MKCRITSLLLLGMATFSHAQLNWRLSNLPKDGTLDGIVFGAGKFHATLAYYTPTWDDTGALVLVSSANGTSWTPNSAGVSASFCASSGGNHLVIADTKTASLCYSANGTSWMRYSSGVDVSDFDGLCFSGGRYVGYGENDGAYNIYYSSTDFTSWETRSISLSNDYQLEVWGDTNRVAFGNNKFVLFADREVDGANAARFFVKGIDEENWTAGDELGDQSIIRSLRFFNGQFIAVGDKGAIYISSDGLHWQKKDSKTSMPLNDVAFGKNILVAVGGLGTIVTSRDNGATWVKNSTGVWSNLRRVCFGNNLFICPGVTEAILRSN